MKPHTTAIQTGREEPHLINLLEEAGIGVENIRVLNTVGGRIQRAHIKTKNTTITYSANRRREELDCHRWIFGTSTEQLSRLREWNIAGDQRRRAAERTYLLLRVPLVLAAIGLGFMSVSAIYATSGAGPLAFVWTIAFLGVCWRGLRGLWRFCYPPNAMSRQLRRRTSHFRNAEML
mgnify:CR=1 FL=1|jgi:hypothetical protein